MLTKAEQKSLHRVAEWLFMYWQQELDDNEFDEKGLAFVLEPGRVKDRKRFQGSVDELVRNGCRPYALFRCLHYFYSSEANRSRVRFPSRREIDSLQSEIREVARKANALEEKYSPFVAIRSGLKLDDMRKKVGPEAFNEALVSTERKRVPCMLKEMLWYADMLEFWRTPRSDVLTSFGPIAVCLYARVVTGKPRFRIVAEMLGSFSGRDIDPSTLRKNLDYFERRFSHFQAGALHRMVFDHAASPEGVVNWQALFDSKPSQWRWARGKPIHQFEPHMPMLSGVLDWPEKPAVKKCKSMQREIDSDFRRLIDLLLSNPGESPGSKPDKSK